MKAKRTLSILLVLIVMLVISVSAAGAASSPFKGRWLATDVMDGSDIHLTVAGNPSGPFRIIWTESYFTLCEGEPGIGMGTGTPVSVTEMDVEIHFRCFTTGTTLDYSATFTYDPAASTLTDGTDTWSKVSGP